jgi:hypothetical protein
MALKPLNSVGGFSVGEVPANIILANGDITASNATFSGNLLISSANASWGVLTNNLYYANGVPWDLGGSAAGSNNQIQYNINGDFAASANFTFDPATNLLTVAGNIDVANADLGNLVVANFANISNDLVVQGNIANANNISITNALSANTGNFSGNITSLNANLGNLATANFVNVASNITTSNLTVNLALSGNTANFTGNLVAGNLSATGVTASTLTSNVSTGTAPLTVSSTTKVTNLNADLLDGYDSSMSATANTVAVRNADGNLTANYFIGNGSQLTGIDATSIQNGNSNVKVAANGNVSISVTGTSNVVVVTDTGMNVAGYITSTGNITAPNFIGNLVGNISGNIVVPGANTQVLFNNDGNAGASANLTFNKDTGLLTVNGNIDTVNADLGNLVVANFANIASNVTTSNLTVNLALSGNTANFTGNLTAANGNLGNLATANFVSVSSNTVTNNLTVNLALAGNTANFSGNLTAANGNLGNLATANFVSVSSNVTTSNLTVNLELAGNTANFSGNLTAANGNLGNLVVANFANIASNVTTSNLTVNLELVGNTANFSGNVVVPNLTVNLALSGNTANFSGNIVALNANLGNLAIANFVQTGTVLNGNSNIAITANSNVVITATSNAVVTISGVGANITGYVTANGEGTFGGVKSNTVTAQGGNLTIYAAAGNNYVELRPTGTGQVDVGNFRIESLQNPVNAQDAATKFYVDTVAEGLHIHASCGAATPDTLANVSSGTITYNNGTAGVGATLVTTGTYTLIDGVNVASVGFRILVKDEANLAHNGIYTYANSTALIRATDFDTAAEIAGGDFTFVTGGTVYNSTGWVQIDEVNTVGTDPIQWDQFSGAGEYTAGQGLTLTGTVFSVNVDNTTTEIAGGNVVVKANAQFTTPNIGAATGTSLAVTGNLVGGNITSNAKVTTADLDATGNILANNISANANLTVNNATVNLALSGNTANFTGNLVVANATVNLQLSGNTANFTGNIAAANANLGNLVTANFFTGVLVNGTSNVKVNSNGNIDLTAESNTTAIITATGANITGYANITGNVSANNLSLTNNISANIANIATRIDLGNTDIGWSTLTTSSITANQTIATFAVSGVTGVEFLVKGIDASGTKYSVATVQAVTDGGNVDYSTFATVNLGGSTGTLAVNIAGSNLSLQVTPSSTNSTVWTTQFRTI